MTGSTVIPTTNFNLKLPYHLQQQQKTPSTTPTTRHRRKRPSLSCYYNKTFTTHFLFRHDGAICSPNSRSFRTVPSRVRSSSDGSGPQHDSVNVAETKPRPSSLGDGYVGLFVRMLGLDNDPLDRELAVVALWKYSLEGKKAVDYIMQFQGCVNLTVNLLKSDLSSTCEAAAGLLRSISSENLYRNVVAGSGAIEAITGLLSHSSLTSEVKEQSICTLWNLSIDENLRVKIANGDVLPLLMKFLEDEDIRVKEAVGGVLANLALTHSNHDIMVEAGVIPKLAKFLTADVEDGFTLLRKEARNVLLELSKHEYYRILIIEEGLVPVPLVGAAAYRTFTPALHSWPSLPDGTTIERTSRNPSRFGASEVLLGLNVNETNTTIDEAKKRAMLGRSKQQFLARSGAIEVEDAKSSKNRQFTLLPWMDGVARLVLILELEDESAICRAAQSIENASINENIRNAFKEAGAIKRLVQLIEHDNDAIQFAAIGALEKLSVSNSVCCVIEAEGVVSPLVNIVKKIDTSEEMMEKALNLLTRVLDPVKEMKLKFYDGPVNRAEKGFDSAESPDVSNDLTANIGETQTTEEITREDVLDSSVIGRAVELLKHSSPNSQRKAAALLELIAVKEANMQILISADIESALDAVFEKAYCAGSPPDVETEEQPQLYALQVEEAGLAASAASRLLTKLLDSEQFSSNINFTKYTETLHRILTSNIPLQYKDWVAACLVKLSSLYGPILENPINTEVTLYETIPRLIGRMGSSYSSEAKEAAVVELNRIVSEGIVDATHAVASNSGIPPLVGLIEEGSERAIDAALSVLYNLSMDSENHPAILAAGAVPALKRIIKSQRPQWKRALLLFRTLPT